MNPTLRHPLLLLPSFSWEEEEVRQGAGTLETSARKGHLWMLPSFHRSVVPLNCTFRCPSFPMRNAKCTFNAWERPFDWKGQNKESIPVVLR